MSITSQAEDIEVNVNKSIVRGAKCKFCGRQNSIKRGMRKNGQMYQCKECGKHFTDNGKFPRMQSNKEIIRFALDSYFEGLSLYIALGGIYESKQLHATVPTTERVK